MFTETLTHLEVGKTVYPFADKKEFLPIDLVKLFCQFSLFPGHKETLLTQALEFQGIRGHLACGSGPYLQRWEPETPLGPVATEIVSVDGLTAVKSFPLALGLAWEVDSSDQVRHFLKYSPRVDLNERQYFIEYHGEDGPLLRAIEDTSDQAPVLILGGDRLIVPPTYRDFIVHGTRTTVSNILLPSEIVKMPQVGLTMVERESLRDAV